MTSNQVMRSFQSYGVEAAAGSKARSNAGRAWPRFGAISSLAGALLLCPTLARATLQDIRLHVVALSDDDGVTRGNTVKGKQFCANVDNANSVFAAAGIRFVFNEATDWDNLNSTALNGLSRSGPNWWILPNSVADTHRGKLVIFLGVPSDQNAYGYPSDTAGTLAVRPGQPLPTNDVKYLAYYNKKENVATGIMASQGPNVSTFPHELGHYLGLFHTHPSWGSLTPAQAASVVLGSGASGVDGDLLSDTPADPGTATVDAVYGTSTRCQAPGVTGPVTVSGVSLNPDRNNIMSYYGCQTGTTGSPYHISTQQIAMINASLATPDRNDLISGALFGDDFFLSSRLFCAGAGDKLLTGDFNGDGRGDLLCNYANGVMSVDLSNTNGEFWSSEWTLTTRNFCLASGDKLYVGDFNGDGRDDLLCNGANGTMSVDLSNTSGEFWSSEWTLANRNFCLGAGDKMVVGNFDHLGGSDIACAAANGTLSVDYANATGQFLGADWSLVGRNFCTASTDVLLAGNFDGTNGDDLLCNSVNGTMSVDLGNANGEFYSSEWTLATRNYCNPALGNKLSVGDFNADGRDDIMCNTNGNLTVDLANNSGEFWSSEWVFANRSFCTMTGGKYVVGDFDGDGGTDLACVGASGSLGVDRVKVPVKQLTACMWTTQ